MSQSTSAASSSNSALPPIARTPATWSDLSQHWHWPKLLKAIPMALGPGRLVLAGLVVLALAGLDKLFVAIFKPAADSAMRNGPFQRIIDLVESGVTTILNGISIRGVNSRGVSSQLYQLFIKDPWTILDSKATFWMVFVAPLFLAIFAVLAGAISRSAACEFAADVRISMGKSISFAMKNFWSLFFAFAAPLAIIWLLALGMAGIGWLMYGWSGIPAFIFSLVYFVYLLVALVISVIAIAYFVSAPMLAPAIASEGTDAYDAIQRAYAYVFSKPFKLVLYVFVIVFAGVLAYSLVATVVYLVVDIANGTTGLLERSRATDANWMRRNSGFIGEIWTLVPFGLLAGFVVSYILCAGTILYLLIRKLADGQEVEEIWMPGMVPGTAAAATAPAATPPASSAPPTPPAAS